jgi:hypothetical protein
MQPKKTYLTERSIGLVKFDCSNRGKGVVIVMLVIPAVKHSV